MEPIAAIGVLTKLIGLGMKGLSAGEAGGFGKADVEALQSLLETGSSFAAMRGSDAPPLAAQHLALVARSFGQAVGRHQRHHGMVVVSGGLRRWLNRTDRQREVEIELRVKTAALEAARLGDDPRGEVALIAALAGSPLNTPYYRRLWAAFSDPGMTLPDEEPPLVMSQTARREFERYFVLSYLTALESPAGKAVAGFLDNLQDYRARRVQELLVQDMATWGGHHMFGNVPPTRWTDDEPVPFLALDALFVEPTAAIDHRAGKPSEPEPILALIERLTALDEPRVVVVVVADFGSGKSITARMLARRWAERALSATSVGLDEVLPIYIRCAEDFSQEAADVSATVRRAWKRQADGFDLSIPDDDPALAWPSNAQRVVCLLDGLDEVALGDQHQKTLFQKLWDKTTRQHRFVVFSRSGAIPARFELGDHVVVVRVQPFSSPQISQWIEGWNRARPDAPPLTPALIDERGLGELARTPILLFMVAFTWERHAAGGDPPSLAEIYEGFFVQIAAGKAAVDREQHGPISKASEALLAALRNHGIFDDRAGLADAMLWLMSRVAWEAQKLEQRDPPELLTRRHIDNLLHDGDLHVPADAAYAIQIGLVLALQADLRTANDSVLFGHQSFREFLVGRHWATHLHRLVRGKQREWDARTSELLGGRLLGEENRSLDFLIQIVNAAPDASRPASPLAWTAPDRAMLVDWAQDAFADDSQRFLRSDRNGLGEDLRAVLREAALAIGSLTKGSAGLRALNPWTLRSMLAWFWARGVDTQLIGGGARFSGAKLADIWLRRAILNGAHLENADLRRAVLDSSILIAARLAGAELSDAFLDDSDLTDAVLTGAWLRRAGLSKACLDRARLDGADLGGAACQDATFVQSSLRGTFLERAVLYRADLSGAVLDDARLQGAQLDNANLTDARLVRADLRAASLIEAQLTHGQFGGADLTGADLTRAELRSANLETAILENTTLDDARYDETTTWPEGFDPVVHGAILVVPE